MERLLAHVGRLRAHACFWQGLPLTSVPSAAVSDEDTAAWSAQMYDHDLATEPEPHTGEVA